MIALDAAAMAAANTGRPHRRKDRIPPGVAALAAAANSATASPPQALSSNQQPPQPIPP